MPKPKVLVLRAAGVNCDEETAYAFELEGAAADRVHVNRLAEGSAKLADYDILAIPGGFSYGDDVASGRIFAVELIGRLGGALREFVKAGKLVIGICNGFQVLVKGGLLPGSKGGAQTATLTTNDSGKFEARWVRLSAPDEKCPCIWTRGLGPVDLPVAHGEGKFVAPDEVIADIEKNNQVVFRYVTADGRPARYPDNPNGAMGGIAGITDMTGRILGLMPHPERHLFGHNHPRWTRRKGASEEGQGRAIFRNGVQFVK